MAATHGIRSTDIKTSDKHGTQQYVQISDGTGTVGNVPKFNADGSLTDGGVAASSLGTWITETPAGVLDGSNTAFTITHTPISGTLTVFLNGVEQDPDRWITLSGTTITFTIAPLSIDFIVAKYSY